MGHPRYLVALVTALGLFVPAMPAAADTPASIEDVVIDHVHQFSGFIGPPFRWRTFASVRGWASFIGPEATVATDGQGDATVPGVGADLTATHLEIAEIGESVLRVRLDVADMSPAGKIPESSSYGGTLRLEHQTLELQTTASSTWFGSSEPFFTVEGCSSNGQCGLFSVEGAWADDGVEWLVPLEAFGFTPGQSVEAGSFTSSVSASHLLRPAPPGSVLALDDIAGGEPFEVPERPTAVGTLWEGEDTELLVQDRALTFSEPYRADFSWLVELTDLAPGGDYYVTIEVFYGDDWFFDIAFFD